jgi:hypothetical protein
LDRFIADGMAIYRTDLHGDVVLTIDGNGNISFVTDNQPSDTAVKTGADTLNA